MAPFSSDAGEVRSLRLPGFDRLGVVVGAIALAGAWLLPFVVARPNRIVAGQPLDVAGALPLLEAVALHGAIAIGIVVALARVPNGWRLICGLIVTGVLAVMLGIAASHLSPPGDSVGRVAPGAGYWVCSLAFALVVVDALARMKPGPYLRLGLLALVVLALAGMLWGGVWRDVSILREYSSRGAAFWSEARTHVLLAFGALGAASVVGLPLSIACYRNRVVRTGVLNILNVVQTIPSIALFGLLIAPLAWVAANIPGAAALGVSGIGFAPAMLALFGYSLLPIVANAVVGLDAVLATVRDAARGAGMTELQVLLQVELPLALPVILTGIRIVLVQNIGLAIIAALIGGGGLGVFVFQGIGQTAMDLVLLGAVPTVALAIASAVILDALVELSRPARIGAQ